ncbi:hypothetical protein AAG570_001005, partial [Ranatra chinensis]
ADNECNIEDKRLWIGNLDPRVTERHIIRFCFVNYWYRLLKLLQKFGAIEKFDLLFHKTGPLAGQPRGYAFVTYVHRQDAQTMMDAVDGTLFGTKNVAVRWAHTMNKVMQQIPILYRLNLKMYSLLL